MRIRIAAPNILLVLSSVWILSNSVLASAFDERHSREAAQNPPDLQFVLRTSQSSFHPGEIIPLTLEFSSASADKYRLNGATYDRSGRLPTEQFILDPDDVVDPFIDYFGSGVMGGIGGGLRSNPTLGPEPHRIQLKLNDWFRFDRPGRYRLFLKSHRLSRMRQPGETGEGLAQFAAVSNILEIEITEPDPAWEMAKLRELETTLDKTDKRAETPEIPVPGVSNELLARLQKPFDEKAREAETELRYLGTREAVTLMLNRARKNDGEIDSLGLIGSPHRAFVAAELERYIQDPNTIVTAWTVRLRTLFDFAAEHPKPLLMQIWELSGRDWTPVQAEAEKRQKEFEQMLRARAIALITLPDRKSAVVREQCVSMLVELAPEEARAAKLIPPDDFGMTREQLIARFESLTEDQQSELLTRKWDLVNGPEMIPVLRRIVVRAPVDRVPTSMAGFSLWHGPANLSEEALERLLKLAPEEARRLLIDDMIRPHPRFAYVAWDALAAQDIPQADLAFAKALEENPAGTMPLIAKFATGALADQVRAVFKSTFRPCEEEKWLVAYFLRTLPREGKDVLAQALTDREQRGCHRFLLGQLSYIIWTNDVEKQAAAALNDPDPETAADAAGALAARAGPEVERALWKRLEKWSEKWRGREKDLGNNPITGEDPRRGDRVLGESLFAAIGTARAWFLDLERANRLVALCLDDWCRKRWSPEASLPARVETANGSPSYGPMFKVAQYSLRTMDDLKSKMTQFPTETVFHWCPQGEWNPSDSFTPGERQAMYDEIAGFLKKRHMHIEAYSKEGCGQ